MLKTCGINGCDNAYLAKGLCRQHYRKQQYIDNKEKELKQSKQYYQENIEYYTEYAKKYHKKYYLENREENCKKARKFHWDNRKKSLERMKKYRLNNKEKFVEYWKANKDKVAERMKKYCADNREKLIKYNKEYRQKNKEKVNAYRRGYAKTPKGKMVGKAARHRRRLLTADLTTKTVQMVYEDNIKKYGTLTCILCLKPIDFGQDSLEHKTPLSRGGNNDYDNLGVSHQSCNYKKHTKTLEEWEHLVKK